MLCEARDPSLSTLLSLAESLTPYAVELRYDDDFWATWGVAREAQDAALTIKSFVLARLPADITPEGPV